jgi:sec-independent protein translocase protein TatA
MGLFGLGGAEIAIVLVAAAFLLGPETLAKMTKEAGKVASEYKDELEKVPDEFKKGYDEAQIDSKSRKAKPMERLPDEK